jgi:HD-GYP domain-containing protein (c-di-GMP phosphodiesterase class II)
MAGQELWKRTRLWTLLAAQQAPEDERTQATVAAILRQAETVLGEGETTPTDYTLHDPEHSGRVAELIAKIADVALEQLSVFELALLLLSSYLHDIGMTPPVGKVKAHFTYLLSGDPGPLTSEEQDSLQVFLDDHWDGDSPPLR